jgi:pentatricopeptide repeat domain-containing protein 3
MARQASSASAGIEEEIVIPPRIERGPTDILRALASTVGTDFTAPHYRYKYRMYWYGTVLISFQIS